MAKPAGIIIVNENLEAYQMMLTGMVYLVKKKK
jgi:hypothetical protein